MTNRNEYFLVIFILGLIVLAALWIAPAAPAVAHEGHFAMCVIAPDTIALDNTERLEVGVYTAELAPEGQTCLPVDDLPDVPLGVGLRGVELGNFQIDPADSRLPGCVAVDGISDCSWVFQAIGEPDSHHNLVIYLYVDDDTRTSGIRTLALTGHRITITDSLTFLEQVGQFFDSTVGRVSALAGAVVAVLGAYAAWRNLRKGEAKQ